MERNRKRANLVLGGGGIKGIAYIGMYEAAEAKGFRFESIGGVSAGALVGAVIGAGYKAQELKRILYETDFDKINIRDISREMPVVQRFIEYFEKGRYINDKSIEDFLQIPAREGHFSEIIESFEFSGSRGDILKNIITYSKEKCLFDGDYIEEWMYKILLKKGIKTFADIRTKNTDKSNPKGYKVRMTAVDANRGKVVVLPDDISFYGIDPDRLEVAKAIRMSTSVPFAFKPVEINKKYGKSSKKHYLVDGGILDNFPLWLIEPSESVPLIGCMLKGKAKFSIFDPLSILKKIISVVHDYGIPDVKDYKNCNIINIDTGNISFLDFNLDEKEKEFLIQSGYKAFNHAFRRRIPISIIKRYGFIYILRRLLGLC
ncbi:MAG TPA: patatin-like phospholipase family protein [Acetivibrio sp.]|nr:patatin-like phospholipase family protein [Acetivibrio sp.]HPT90589.1 patatin-like phospholipase family protein [Acetivibrio sp.]